MLLPDNKYRWHAVYVRYLHEKKVRNFLNENEVISYLPLETKLRLWSDRKKKIEVPVFPCYVFVNVSNREYYRVLQHPSAVRYVKFEGLPVVIPEKQIESIRKILASGLKYSIHSSSIRAGKTVSFAKGLFKGNTGEIVRISGREKLVIRISNIGYALLVHINENCVEPIREY
jgi:transcriptional antiterminator RfaH